ncbi:MAG: hypothetical protein V3R99_02485 [Thermoguttaceae bacterium]
MYELARGPLLWIAMLVFIGGVAYRVVQLFLLTRKKERVYCPPGSIKAESPAGRKFRVVLALQNSLLGQHPVMAIGSFVFHCCLFAVPIFCLGHNVLLRQAIGLSFLSVPDGLTNFLTIIILLGVLFFFLRRLVVPRVRAVSAPYDHAVLLITAAPFLTGLLAYYQWGDYRTILTCHALAGDLMLIAIPFTKLGHMVFFFFARFFLGSEYSFGRGGREWTT